MRAFLAAVLLLVLGACALPQERSRTFTPYAPLEAYITSTVNGRPLFHVNRPAYAAMFYIAPGQGVSLLYPGYGSGSLTGRVFAGSHFASSRLSNSAQFAPSRAAMYGPRYYFLIASDRPLNVQQFGAFGTGLWSSLGTSFASYSPYSTMEDIARLTLPALVNDGSWTTDFYVAWPSVIFDEAGPRRVLVRCNGYAMWVEASYVARVQSLLCARAETDDRVDPKPDEDGENNGPVVKPGQRAPLPGQAAPAPADEGTRVSPADRRAIRERLAVSSQLAGPEARRVIEAPRDEYGHIRSRERPSYGSPSGSGATYGDAGSGSSRPSSRGAADSGGSSRGSAGAAATPASPGSRGATAAPAPRPSSDGGASSAPSGGRQGRSRATVD